MMISSPSPAAVPKPAPAAPTALPATPAPTPAPTGGAPAAPAGPTAPAAGAPKAPAADPSAPTREEFIAKTMSMTAQDAAASVVENFTSLSKLTIGGGTPEGLEQAKVASTLLTDSSNMLQLAHLKATDHLRSLADELDMRMIAASTQLAFLGGQVALAGGSKDAVKIADVAAEPIKAAVQTLSDVLAAIAPKQADGADPAAPAAPAPAAPKAAPAAPSAPAAPAAPAPAAPAAPAPAAAPPGNLQHVTPGPGTGRGPNLA